MSLSKLHKNSASFEPENIVKQSDKAASGWQSAAPAKQSPFEEQRLPRKMEVPQIKQSEERQETTTLPAEKTDTPAQHESETEAPAGGGTDGKIDLSDYIGISEHEKLLEEAYRRGKREKLEQVDRDYESATKALLLACRQLDEIRNTIINNSSSELQEFALSIAERILRISLAEQDHSIVAAVEEALNKAVRSDEFTVFINPDDFDAVTARSQELLSEISGLSNLVIKKDSTIERGGARIESENCIIDATVGSQFDTIREEVRKNM